MPTPLEQLSQNLSRLATHYDVTGLWPELSLQFLTQAGAWTWIVPREYGGLGLDPLSQIAAYEAAAAGCMSCALILTQRDGACEFIASSENQAARAALLPRLARHELMASIGISHLTTSRQGAKPALTASAEGNAYRLNGFIPWVTAAPMCDGIVTAGVLNDGGQLLVWLPLKAEGVLIDPPMRLMALQSSQTCEVHCRNVRINAEHVLRGPLDDALRRRSPVKSLIVSATGIGLAGALVRDMTAHAGDTKGPLRELLDDAIARYEGTRTRVMSFAADLAQPDSNIPKLEIRVAVNDLLMRLALAAITFGKGTGFIRQRDTQRLAREALFFLVWSAPEDVRSKTLANFLEPPILETKSMPI
ncbi:MAG TPA: acyl-CoA dehydrogenase family protein [Phycisphaerae bacterium]|nr:acyl-CoA dehydrogenase family protein [Phycisphaerae bacterium]